MRIAKIFRDAGTLSCLSEENHPHLLEPVQTCYNAGVDGRLEGQ
jgi:hypothetical protein